MIALLDLSVPAIDEDELPILHQAGHGWRCMLACQHSVLPNRLPNLPSQWQWRQFGWHQPTDLRLHVWNLFAPPVNAVLEAQSPP